MSLLAALPIIAFFALLRFAASLATPCREDPREALLLACASWAAVVVIITEGLSLVSALDARAVAVAWTLPILLLLGISPPGARLGWRRPSVGLSDRLFLVAIGGVVSVVALIALRAPPHTYDALEYHMSRVAHWIQNGSVSHYPTHVVRQLYLDPWTEFAILQFQLLAGSDILANMVQWSSMVGSAVAASLIVKELGGSSLAQWLGALMVVTLPMGVLEASSAKNDYAAALWSSCFVYWALRSRRPDSGATPGVAAALCLGLAALTKATTYLFLAPFVVWLVASTLGRGWTRAWRPLVALLIIPAAINSGHFARNWRVFGNPLGPDAEDVGPSLTIVADTGMVAAFGDRGRLVYANETVSPAAVLSNVLRNASLHAVSNVERADATVERAVRVAHRILRIDPDDPRTTWSGRYRLPDVAWSETYTGNPVHFALFLLLTAWLPLGKPRRGPNAAVTRYLVAVLAGALTFCAYLKWQPFHSRLHLPWFVLMAPLVAYGVTDITKSVREGTMAAIAAVPCLAGAFNPLLQSHERPLLGPHSVLVTPRNDMYIPDDPILLGHYRAVASAIRATPCRSLGLIMHGLNDAEYPLWAVLDGGSGFRIEHVEVRNASRSSARAASEFMPCMVVTTTFGRVVPGTFRGSEETFRLLASFGPLHVYELD